MENDPTKLTSFQPLTPVSSNSRFSFSKWLDSLSNKRKLSQAPNLPSTKEQSTSKSDKYAGGADLEDSAAGEREDFNSWLTKSISSQSKLFGSKEGKPENQLVQAAPRKEKWRYRNVRTILRRLSALTIDKRWHQTTGDFKDDFKQYWMPDEHCKECYECSDKFNTFRRRHHCRVCGQIFCYKCCGQEVHGKVIGFSGEIRVCNYCQKIVQAYLNDDLENSIEALNEDIKAVEQGYRYEINSSSGSLSKSGGKNLNESGYTMKRSPSSNSITSVSERAGTPTVQRSPFDMFGVDPSEANSIKQDYLRDIWKQIIDPRVGMELQSHRYRLKLYNNCLVGNELSDWLIHHSKANTRQEAVYIGQDLLNNGWLECAYPSEPIFLDEYMLYQPTKKAIIEAEKAVVEAQSNISTDEESDHGLTTLDLRIETPALNTLKSPQHEDDEPNWLKQISSVAKEEDGSHLTSSMSGFQFRTFSTGKQLDLDLTAENEHSKSSLQMNLPSQKGGEGGERNEIYDQTNKVSFITQAPPLPLDTYVNVEGYQNPGKKKMPKQHSTQNILSEDILKGVVFPRSSSSALSSEIQVEDRMEDTGTQDTSETLSKDRINFASQHHINCLFEQLLKQENLSISWKDIILPFIFKISDKVVPDVRRDDMDIRRYVWITKVVGGEKVDCRFISGVVLRKNVAHKRMSGSFTSPSILMLSCAIEYQRVENKMSSLDPLVLQEYAFLSNFVKRVLALKPNLILVEKNVARVAQDMLLAGGVTLVHNIKAQTMENIARCTGADILQTMEQVTRPRLGKCQNFRLQKYSLSNGNYKVLMFFDGCAPDLGCSLVLRGGNKNTLNKLRKIISYLIYVAYQLKLEAKFLADEFALPPESSSSDDPESRKESGETSIQLMNSDDTEAACFEKVLNRMMLSSSPNCCYPLPYLLTKEGQKCPSRNFIAEKIYYSRYLDGSLDNPKHFPEDDCEWIEKKKVNKKVIMKDPHSFTDPSSLLDCLQADGSLGMLLNDFRARGGCIDLRMFEEYDQREKQNVFGDYVLNDDSDNEMDNVDGFNKNQEPDYPNDDFLSKKQPLEQNKETKLDCFDAFNHHRIAVLFSSYSSESKNAPKPCISPWAVFMGFYGRNDITLGGFLERYCFRPSYICPSHNCDVPMVNHVRYFAHGNGSLYIHMRNLESPIPGYDRTILTWSWCKICKQVTPVVPLSFESWAMSFAKYLELRFYGVDYKRRASVEPCHHSLHHDHYQYFSYTNMVASFKYRTIDLYEVVIPMKKVLIGKQRNPKHILNDVEELCKKVDSAMSAVRERINDLAKADDQFNSAIREAKIQEFLADLEKEESNTKNVVAVIKLKTDSFTRSITSETPSPTTKQPSTTLLTTGSTTSLTTTPIPLATSSTSSLGVEQSLMTMKKSSSSTSILESATGVGATAESLSVDATNVAIDRSNQTSIQQQQQQQSTGVEASSSSLSSSVTSEGVVLTSVELNKKSLPQQENQGEQQPPQQSQQQPQQVDQQLQLMIQQHSTVYNHELSNEEVHLLWVDIARKVFYLKKNICESVEHWNHKLQEFITQNRKREKAYVGINPIKMPTDITEYYPEPSAVEMGPPQPKTITHMHPEPVSEVFLTNGTILRQTHYGTTPRDSPLIESSTESSPAKQRKASSNNPDLSLKLDEHQYGQGTTRSEGGQAKSPYMLIKSPSHDIEGSSGSEPPLPVVDGDGRIIPKDGGVGAATANITDPVRVNLGLGASNQSDEEEDENGLFAENKQHGYSPNNHQQRMEAKALFDIDYDNEDEINSMFAANNTTNNISKSGRTRVDSAEEVEDKSRISKTLIRQQRVGDQPTKQQGATAAGIQSSKYKIKDANKKTTAMGTGSVNKLSGSFTQFPKVKELNMERIEYLTPKEVKAMQVARRRRNEWESRIKAAKDKDMATSPMVARSSKMVEEEGLDITEDHFDSTGPGIDRHRPSCASGKQSGANNSKPTNTMRSRVAKGKKHLRNQILRRLVQTNVDSSEEEPDVKKKGGQKVLVTAVDTRKSPTPSSSFKPVKIEQDIPSHAHPLHQLDSMQGGSLSPDTPIKSQLRSDSKNKSIGPDFNNRVKMGHRRMKSAPLRMASLDVEDRSVESELTPKSPFVYISPAPSNEEPVLRIRSQSMGNKNAKKKELRRLAEMVVKEDRIDVERDVPEVLQVEQNSIKSASAGEITSHTAAVDGTKGPETKGVVSTSDDDKKLVELKKGRLGHTRHKSLTSRSIDVDAPDGIRLISGEGTNKGRGGSEKMKKMISNLLANTTFNPIPRPFPSSEQYLPQVGGTASIVINELEPTSLIAFTLSNNSTNKGNNRSNLATPNSITISQPNSPNPGRRKPVDNHPSSRGYVSQLPLPISGVDDRRSWIDSTEGSLSTEISDIMDKSHLPAPTPEPSILKSVGRKHPLSSTGYENEMMSNASLSGVSTGGGGGEIDLDEMSNDEVLMEESLKADETKKKDEKTSLNHHIKLQFQNDVAKFYCSVYFAEQFRQLREQIFPEGEERFIQSLSRCKFWKATGGKSGSSFSKSYDDRFVMKQMSRLEVQSFVDFGPRYFDYINKAIKEDRPTALAKLLGVYRIGFKNSATNATMRQDVLVMENLFYEKKVNKIFDLKGSLRGRKAQQATKEDVLLDENLLEMICDSPLFIRGHSKSILSKAIHNDTEFLSTNMVMDYSLLVGIDESNMELVVGIIDYIRTYTWDKKLESYVKSTGILGGAGKMPTVVSPDLYRTRFTEAMQRYFLMVPDIWTGFGNELS